MSDFKPEDVKKLAALARIRLEASEEAPLAKDIDAILSYVSVIATVTGEAKGTITQLRNVMRDDGEPHESGLYTKRLLSAAPQKEGSHIAVKKIISK